MSESNQSSSETNETSIETSNVPETETVELTPDTAQVALEYNWSKPVEEKEMKDPSTVFIPMASLSVKESKDHVSSIPSINITDNPEAEEWVNVFKNGLYTTPNSNVFYRTVNKESANYRQAIPSEKGPLGYSAPKILDNNSSIVSGEVALTRIRAAIGLGTNIATPLWHSGFWISFKAPADSDVLELHRRLSEEKISLGRVTWGLAFSNTSVFFNNWLIDFAIANMYETTLKLPPEEDIRKYISCLDIPAIVWGLAAVIWPRGFNYARSVMNNQNGETKIIREKLNITKLQWTDRQSLTEWQIAHMSNRKGGTMTLESIAKYKDEFVTVKGRTVKLSDNISMTFKVPNILEYREAGEKWITSIVTLVDTVLGMTNDNDERDNYITVQSRASYMRQYGHWVESISVNDSAIMDVSTIESSLSLLSSEKDIVNNYFNEVIKYIEDATVSIIALPAIVEDGEQNSVKFPNLVAIDAMYVFFIQLGQTVLQIQARNYDNT